VSFGHAVFLGVGSYAAVWSFKLLSMNVLPAVLCAMGVSGLFALAIGFAVSVGQYLPTIFAGGGRFSTLTVEAVTLSSGSDPRVTGIYALVQAGLPLLVYMLAIAYPAWRYRHRKGMG